MFKTVKIFMIIKLTVHNIVMDKTNDVLVAFVQCSFSVTDIPLQVLLIFCKLFFIFVLFCFHLKLQLFCCCFVIFIFLNVFVFFLLKIQLFCCFYNFYYSLKNIYFQSFYISVYIFVILQLNFVVSLLLLLICNMIF